MPEATTTPPSEQGSGWLAFFILLLAALAVHLWLLDARWINPDEGAHLMDGRFVLDGLVPQIDFGGRQPFYVLATAAVLKVFGVGFVSGRVLALTSTLGAAALIYAIARDLFDSKAALLSAALFLFMPFSLMLSVNAKTEPLAILLACGVIWLGMKGARSRAGAAFFFVGAGVLSALGFYVRESSLAIPVALILALTLSLRRSPGRLLAATAGIATGFLAISLLVGAFYARHSSVEEVLRKESINPIAFVFGNVRRVGAAVQRRLDGPSGALESPPSRPYNGLSIPLENPGLSSPLENPPSQPQSTRVGGAQTFDRTLRNVVQTVRFNALFIAGAVLYALLAAVRLGARRQSGDSQEEGLSALVLFAWAGVLGAAYLFWILRRGFFQAYFLEILPPLVILTAAVGVGSARRFVKDTDRVRLGLGLALLVGALLVIPGAYGSLPMSRPLYFFVPTGVLAVIHLSDSGTSGRWPLGLLGIVSLSIVGVVAGPLLPRALALGLYTLMAAGVFTLLYWAARISWIRTPETAISFASYAVVVSAFFLTLAESIPRVGLAYDGIWGPEVVRVVAEEIRGRTDPDAEVLSGGVIWELQAGRRPFMNESHPLRLQDAPVDEVAPPIRRRLAANPPSVVVFDGYTERTYVLALPDLRAFVETRYTRTLTVRTDTRYPIEVYVLNE